MLTPLEIKIIAGKEDDRLLEHIERLQSFMQDGSISDRELITYDVAYARLDTITRPPR